MILVSLNFMFEQKYQYINKAQTKYFYARELLLKVR